MFERIKSYNNQHIAVEISIGFYLFLLSFFLLAHYFLLKPSFLEMWWYNWVLTIACTITIWLIQFWLLQKIRYNSEKRLYKFRIIIYYLFIVGGLPFITICIVLVGVYIGSLEKQLTHYLLLNFIFYICAIPVFSNLIFDVYLLSKQKHFVDINAKQTMFEKRRLELQLLKAQIDPHFLYNTLSNITYLDREKKNELPEFVSRFGDMYRTILKLLEKDWVLLKEELAFSKNYFSLIKYKTGEHIKLSVLISDADQRNWKIIPISLQLLIENAIKHNAYSVQTPLEIEILIEDEYCLVINNVIPLIEKRITSAMGLKNLVERYEFLMHKLPHFEINDTHFIAKIPLKK